MNEREIEAPEQAEDNKRTQDLRTQPIPKLLLQYAIPAVVGTVVLFLACLAIGMEPSRALLNGLWLSTASFNTGGMSSMSLGR